MAKSNKPPRSFIRYVEEELGKFPCFMMYATLEWSLLMFLSINEFLVFFAHEFAKYFELRIPCLLCRRIDHLLVRQDPDFYFNESICECHRKAISSLAFCYHHKKLIDIRKMCESCLLSFATEKESDYSTYKSLVGILHKDLDCFVDHDRIQIGFPVAKRNSFLPSTDKTGNDRCACCGEPLKGKPTCSTGKDISLLSQAPSPSPRFSPFPPLSNGEYSRITEVKLMSDNELELPEDGRASSVSNQNSKYDESSRSSNRFSAAPLQRTESADAYIDLRQFKREVRLDRKSLMDLYMELDEERNASAIAANNAMAMITKLQDEKAALQMEALQYQRMTEEQAEYDQKVLQSTRETLTKREEYIKVLEVELNAYKETYGVLPGYRLFNSFKEKTEEDFENFLSPHSVSDCLGSPMIVYEDKDQLKSPRVQKVDNWRLSDQGIIG